MKEMMLGLMVTIGAIAAAPNSQAQENPDSPKKETTPKVQQDIQSTDTQPIVVAKPTIETFDTEPIIIPSPRPSNTVPKARAVTAAPTAPSTLSAEPQYSNTQRVEKKTIEQESPIDRSTAPIRITNLQTLSSTPLTNFSKLVVFGDSLSDSRTSSKNTSPAPYFHGRPSNGLLWTEDLVAALKTKDDLSNFAVSATQSKDIQQQIQQYLNTSSDLKSSNIHVVWTGTNDYRLGGSNPQWTVNNIQTSIQTLTSAGAKRLLVANLMDLGKAPIHLPTTSASALSQLSQEHNQRLHQRLRDLAAQRPDLYVVPLDFYALFSEMFKDPTRFGFKSNAHSCLITCTNPNQYILLDVIHPTESTHRILSDYTLSILNAPQSIAPQVGLVEAVVSQQNKTIEAQLELQRHNKGSKNNPKPLVFASGDFLFGEQSGIDSRSKSSRFSSTGVTIGVTQRVGPDFIVGMAFHHAKTNSTLAEKNGTIAVDGNSLSLYAQKQFNRLFINGMISYGWNSFNITRPLNVTGFDTATASPTGNQLSAQLKLGYTLIGSENDASGLRLTPTIGLGYQKITIHDYREANGNILNLNVKEQNSNSVILALGGQLSYGIRVGKSMITPYLDVSYEHALTDGSRIITTELATQPGIPMRSAIGRVDPNSVRLGVGVRTQIQDAFSFTLGYETGFGQNLNGSHRVQGLLNFTF